jgi:hypothetical protein
LSAAHPRGLKPVDQLPLARPTEIVEKARVALSEYAQLVKALDGDDETGFRALTRWAGATQWMVDLAVRLIQTPRSYAPRASGLRKRPRIRARR